MIKLVTVKLKSSREQEGSLKVALSQLLSEISGNHIPIDKLVTLLEFLHIIAKISSHQSPPVSSSCQEEVTYMMPCVLRNATTEELDAISKKPQEVPPILFHFKCGSVPIGVFPALIACLISNTSFMLIQDGIYKNAVQFRFGDFYTLSTLICRPTYYECIISKFSCDEVQPHIECESIRREIESTLSTVSSRVNYGSFMDYEFAFDCLLHPDNGREHLCVVDKTKLSSGMMLCLNNAVNCEPVKVPAKMRVWFGQALPKVTTIDSSETRITTNPTADFPVTLRSLCVLKRKKADGSVERLHLIKEVCARWKEIGDLMELSVNRLSAIEKDRCTTEECCREVFCDWLNEEAGTDYPVTWQGVCDLLEDLKLIQLVKDLKQYVQI